MYWMTVTHLSGETIASQQASSISGALTQAAFALRGWLGKQEAGAHADEGIARLYDEDGQLAFTLRAIAHQGGVSE